MRTPNRGFSLLEALCTMFLVGIVIATIGSLITDAARVSRRAARLSETTAAASLLEFTVLDIERALSFSLTPGIESNQLQMTIRRVDHTDFLETPPVPVDDPRFMKQVTYQVTGGQLTRVSTFDSDPTQTETLGKAQDFFATLLASGQIQIRLVLEEDEVRKEVFPSTIASLAAPL